MSQPGNNVSASNKSSTRRRKGVVLAVAALLLFLLVWSPWDRVSDPVYQGKRVSEWFELYFADDYGNPSQDGPAPSLTAFQEMEGDAIPFLIKQLEARQITTDLAFQWLKANLPRGLAGWVPDYRDSSHYSRRQQATLQLLKHVGMVQRSNAAQGIDTGKPSIALAVEPLREHLAIDATGAASALWWIGPPAAPAVPDLIEVARTGDEIPQVMAVQAFGLIGPAASNAVPLLIELAEDTTNKCHVLAITSLGGMGRVAEPALPVLTSLLSSTNSQARLMAARAIASIGATPDEAVEQLEILRDSDNETMRSWATLALWNRTPHDPDLTASLVVSLKSDKPTPLLYCLVVLGTDAASLRPFVEPLAESDDLNARSFSRKFLYKLDNPVP